MSTMQRMTLIGLYNYEQTFDVDLFKNLALPDGYDKTTFVNSLLLEHGEKCVLYTNPDFFMVAIGIWSSKYALELSRIHEALVAEYNPIWNYDRNEEWSDEGTGKTSSETQGDRKNTSETAAGRRNTSETDATRNAESKTNAGHKAQDGQNYDDVTTNDYDVTTSNVTDGTVEHEVSADNSGTYQPEWKETRDAGSQKTENDGTISKHVEGTTQNLVESTNSKTEDEATDNSKTVESSVDNSKTVDTGADNSKTVGSSADKSKHTGHLWGNIGVTTSASMVTEVVEQRFKISLYGTATRMFANELLIGIW